MLSRAHESCSQPSTCRSLSRRYLSVKIVFFSGQQCEHGGWPGAAPFTQAGALFGVAAHPIPLGR